VAVGNFPGGLLRRHRGVNRYVTGAECLNGHIGYEPFPAVFRNERDAIPGLHGVLLQHAHVVLRLFFELAPS
jgi:hypothetical protein